LDPRPKRDQTGGKGLQTLENNKGGAMKILEMESRINKIIRALIEDNLNELNIKIVNFARGKANIFRTTDIFKALGIPRERLKDWQNNGFCKPTIPAKGKGYAATYTINDLYMIGLLQLLIDFGFKRRVAARISELVIGN
jgi:hypothetical protein